ncbi:unnamed protein product [Miscanthus lutarioriparius]|uniref:CCHC-type domain-containing protein n=1 Tax=Miscanthus lutarioriparius TaxID=422564 RepID=A0A811QJ55_9POAL|nr:unnamed protein product [Miscanthus lutarioriparius]
MSERSGSSGGGSGGGDRGDRINYPALTATNYTSWSIRVQAIMEDQGVWEIMEPTGETLDQGATAVAARKAKNIKARVHLLQCLPDDLLMQVATKKTGKEVWDSLKARFVGEERVKEARLQTLKSEFDGLTMKEEESIDVYAGKLTSMSVRYANLGGSLDDSALGKKMFDTVPERFINVIAGIEQFYDLKKLAFDEAVGRLKAFEERTKRGAGGAKSDIGQVLLTQAEWEARQKKMGGENSGSGRGHGSSRGRGRGRSGGNGGRGNQADGGKYGSGKKDKSHIKCFKCHLYGHYANKCPGENKKEEEAHHVKAVEYEPAVLFTESVTSEQADYQLSETDQAQESLLLNEVKVFPELYFTGDDDSGRDVWYLDNGASNHMTGEHHKFRSIDNSVSGKVRFGDGSAVEIHCRGSILFQGPSEDGSKAHRLYNPQTRKMVVSRDVIFEEEVAWVWNTELGENSEFSEETVGETVQTFTVGIGVGVNPQIHPDQHSGGVGNAGDSVESTGEVGGSVQHETETLSDTIDSQTTGENASPAQSDNVIHGDVDMIDSSDHDETPVSSRGESGSAGFQIGDGAGAVADAGDRALDHDVVQQWRFS